VLDVEVQSNKCHAAKHSLPCQRQLIEDLTAEKRPTLVRGDSAFGNEGVMAEMEEIGQRYLFKLRQRAGIKRLIERKWQQNQWQPVVQGFDAVEDEIQLAGWSRARRIVVLRRQVKNNLALEMNADTQQGTLHFVDHPDKIKVWEYAVLVTNADYSLEAFGQWYQDRADCENGFDELKNQWSWDVIPRMTWSAVISQHEQSRSSITGGVGMCAWHTPKHIWKRLPVALCYLTGLLV
jgi:hypothetical protein